MAIPQAAAVAASLKLDEICAAANELLPFFRHFLAVPAIKTAKNGSDCQANKRQNAKACGMRHAVCGMRHAAALCVNNNGTPRRPPPKTRKKRYKCRWNLLARINQHTQTHMTHDTCVCVGVCVLLHNCFVFLTWLVLLILFFYLLSHLSYLEVNQDLCVLPFADKLICDLPSGSYIEICINIICPRLHVNLRKGHKNETCHAPSCSPILNSARS